MTILNKVKWILGVLLVFLLIVSTNLIDRNSFKQVRNSIETIYEDRLVAKGFLYDISNLLHEKEIAYLRQDTAFFRKNNHEINMKIEKIIELFSQTRLVGQETKTLDKLLVNFKNLEDIEENMPLLLSGENQNWIKQLNKVKGYTNKLSKIQVKEGEKQFAITKKAMNIVDLSTKIEIYLLIFLALVIQFIVIYSSPNKKTD